MESVFLSLFRMMDELKINSNTQCLSSVCIILLMYLYLVLKFRFFKGKDFL